MTVMGYKEQVGLDIFARIELVTIISNEEETSRTWSVQSDGQNGMYISRMFGLGCGGSG